MTRRAVAAGPSPQADTRQRILDAATSLFLQRGYSGVSMSDIGAAVDLTPPALYWYFESKEDLFFQVLHSGLTAFVQAVGETVTATRPTDRLVQFVRAHVLWQIELRDVASAYGALYAGGHALEYMDESRRDELVGLQRRHLDRLRGVLQAGIDAGEFSVADVTAVAFAIINMCEYVVSWFRRPGRLTPEATANLYADLALRMVAARL